VILRPIGGNHKKLDSMLFPYPTIVHPKFPKQSEKIILVAAAPLYVIKIKWIVTGVY
jgi:hypothetical protein